MFFLLRIGFWFSLVLLALPFGFSSGAPGEDGIGPLRALVAAREAVADVAGLCERKPEVCQAGKEAIHTVGARATHTARMALEMLDNGTAPADDVETTGSIAP